MESQIMDRATYTSDGFDIEVMFCKTHDYPALRYTEDGSVNCMWELVVGENTDNHQLIPLAWI